MRRLLSFIAAISLIAQPVFASGFSSTAAAGGGTTTSALTANNSGSGAASGSTFNGSAPITVSTNTLGALKASNNLSDVTAATARTNLGVTATGADTTYNYRANNLSDVASVTTAALNLGTGTVLGQSAAQVSHTGDTVEFTLATITVPAGAMGANGRLVIAARFTYTGSSGSRTPRIKFGGTTIASASAISSVTLDRYNVEAGNRNSASSQFTVFDRASSTGTVAPTFGTAAIDSSSSVTILITGQLTSAADTITLESYQVILNPKG